MAEAMEFDFSLPSNEGKKFDPELVEKVKKIQQEANGKTQTEDIPEAYRVENYYIDDELGADVLKNKYLAPWENHPSTAPLAHGTCILNINYLPPRARSEPGLQR